MAESATRSVINVDSLSVSIGDLDVISDLTLQLSPGEAVGLVGESGSGKSVACRALTGTLGLIGGRVESGTLEIDGVPMATATEKQWRALRGREIALVPQASMSALDPLMRIGSQLKETIRIHDRDVDARQRGRELMDSVGLAPELIRRYPHELSGGQRQRVMIALALAGRPKVLIADEPTTALDVTVQRSILKQLGTLCREHQMSLILVSHDIGVIEQVCDRVVVMYGGCSVESGSIAAITGRPAHPYTQALLAARPTLDGHELVGIPGMPPTPLAWPSGCRFEARCPVAQEDCSRTRPVFTHHSPTAGVACIHPRDTDQMAENR